MKLSYSTLGCPEWTLDRVASNGKNYGFDGIELRTHSDGNHLYPNTPLDEAADLAYQFRATGIPIVSIMGYSRFATIDTAEITANQELLGQLVDLAAAMKAPYVRTFAGQLPKGQSRDQLIQTICDAIRPIAVRAADQGITIGLETHDDWCNARNVMQLVEGVDSDGFGVVYDICNAYDANGEDWRGTYETIKEHICYCHVKDAWVLPDGQHEYVFLGAGDIPYADIFSQLKADGYNSYLSLEWEKKWIPELPEPEQAFPHYVHKIRQMWEHA